ncbi:unnamed protein product [Prunus brigantina]
MLIDESDYYCIHVRKTTEEPTLNNLSQNQNQGVPIKFELYSSTDNAWTMAEDDNFEHPVRIIQEPLDLITETTIRVPCASSAELLSHTGRHTVVTMVTEVLNTLNIPEHEHQSVVDKLFRAFVESPDLTIEPDNVFVVGIEHVIFRMHFVNDYQMVYGLGFPFVPATASSIEGLEEVSVDGLDGTCVICMENFGEDDYGGHARRLPCSHLYHEDCIVEWLETSHLCPVCRYPMPHNNAD